MIMSLFSIIAAGDNGIPSIHLGFSTGSNSDPLPTPRGRRGSVMPLPHQAATSPSNQQEHQLRYSPANTKHPRRDSSFSEQLPDEDDQTWHDSDVGADGIARSNQAEMAHSDETLPSPSHQGSSSNAASKEEKQQPPTVSNNQSPGSSAEGESSSCWQCLLDWLCCGYCSK